MAATVRGIDRLKVLCVTPTGPDGKGGIDRLYYYMRQHMLEAGSSRDLDVHYFAARGAMEGWRSFVTFPFRILAFVWVMLWYRIDVVHINHSTHGSAIRKWALGSLAKLMRRKVTTHFHGMITPEDFAASPLWLKAFRSLCAQSDRIVVLGDVFITYFREKLGIDQEKLIVIPNGIPDFGMDCAIPRQSTGDKLILFAGEVGPRKGAGLLLEALAILRQKTPGWRCVMAGNGDIREYTAMMTMLGLKDRVSFTGWVSSDAVHELMRQADIVVLPSRVEALPLSLIEGACAGAALVASDAGASAEVAREGRNGRIIPLESEGIADALAALLSRPGELARMQTESRQLYLERFRIEQFETQWHDMLLSLDEKPVPSAAMVTAS